MAFGDEETRASARELGTAIGFSVVSEESSTSIGAAVNTAAPTSDSGN
jgi:hypothetical protein